MMRGKLQSCQYIGSYSLVCACLCLGRLEKHPFPLLNETRKSVTFSCIHIPFQAKSTETNIRSEGIQWGIPQRAPALGAGGGRQPKEALRRKPLASPLTTQSRERHLSKVECKCWSPFLFLIWRVQGLPEILGMLWHASQLVVLAGSALGLAWCRSESIWALVESRHLTCLCVDESIHSLPM